MKYISRVLSNGTEMPSIGLGVWQSRPGKEVQNAVLYALDAGYRLIDTAMVYGNESDVGEAIRNSQVPREDIFITTKLWHTDHGYEKTKKAFEESMKKLKLDYIDLYLIHFPATPLVAESWRAMEELYKEGYIRAIGVSNFHEQHLKQLLKTAELTPMVDQVEYHPYLAHKSLRAFLKKYNIQMEAWSPLGMGRLVDDRNIADIANKYGKTVPQIILKWNLQTEVIPLPKSVHKKFIGENIDIFDFQLSSKDMNYINSLDENHHTGTNPDDFPTYN
ncbi:MAG: aldo/keto reductase [Sporolactobacillus sp.]